MNSPKWLRPVAIVALVWNLLGCAAFLSDLTLTPADVATAGCIGLVLLARTASRRRWLFQPR